MKIDCWFVCCYNLGQEGITVKVNYNTQITIELAQRVNEYMKKNEVSRAALTEAAIAEYLDKKETKAAGKNKDK